MNAPTPKADALRAMREARFADRNKAKPRDLMPARPAASTAELAAAIAKVKPRAAKPKKKAKRNA